MKARIFKTCIVVFLLEIIVTYSVSAQQGAQNGQWRSYGGDAGSTKYAPLDQITAENVGNLEIAWKWESIDTPLLDQVRGRVGRFEGTPLMIDGVLYTSTSLSQVAAIDAGTGKTIWTFDSGGWKKGRPANLGFVHRGVAYWTDGTKGKIIIATGDSNLIALDPNTGDVLTDFGTNGKIDLTEGLNRKPRLQEHQVNSPPIVCNDVIVVGSVIFDRPSTKHYVRGDIRGFDARTGNQLWTFHSIPQAGEFGNETWENDSWKYTGNTNVWSLMSADEGLDYVYLPFGAATNDFYGGHRHGDNLFATSLVCLNAKTGKRVWHFQTVHHDLWDYDLPCAPNLMNIVVDGKSIKAVAQMSKTGFCYAFDRVTGKPIWPIPEVAVPQSTTPGEKTSPTQPMPTKPPPFAVQGVTEDTVIDYTPDLKKEAIEIVKKHGGFAPLFTPGTSEGVNMTPGDGGGANWMGAAVDPETSLVYVPAISYTVNLKLSQPDPARSDMKYLVTGLPQGVRGPKGLPLIKGPYSRITAIDMKDGTHAWMKPVGRGIENHRALKDLNLPSTGGGGWAFPMVTKTLLFGGHGNKMLAMDKATGELISELELKDSDGKSLGSVSGAPLTYMHEGKQYIAVSVTGGGTAYVLGLALR